MFDRQHRTASKKHRVLMVLAVPLLVVASSIVSIAASAVLEVTPAGASTPISYYCYSAVVVGSCQTLSSTSLDGLPSIIGALNEVCAAMPQGLSQPPVYICQPNVPNANYPGYDTHIDLSALSPNLDLTLLHTTTFTNESGCTSYIIESGATNSNGFDGGIGAGVTLTYETC